MSPPLRVSFSADRMSSSLIDKGGKEILEELGRKVESALFEQRHADAVKRAMDRAKSPPSPGKAEEAHLCGRPDAERQSLQNGSHGIEHANGI